MILQSVDISELKPHSQNYRTHNDEQLDHIVESIKKYGIYKNVVTAEDLTILAGHGVVAAAVKLDIKQIPIVRLKLKPDSKQALKILTGDNEISRLGGVDDRLLSEILRDIKIDDSLLGTGFDDMKLANLVFTTRPESEIKDFDAAKEWVGLPSYDSVDESALNDPILVITFRNEDARLEFVEQTKLRIASKRGGRKWATSWPFVERVDLATVKFESTR